jgi:hypothetical protein
VHHGAGAPTFLDSGERAARDGAIAAMLVVRTASSAFGPTLTTGGRCGIISRWCWAAQFRRGCGHPIQRDRRGSFSIRINDQFRICFRWTASGPEDVEIVDYH